MLSSINRFQHVPLKLLFYGSFSSPNGLPSVPSSNVLVITYKTLNKLGPRYRKDGLLSQFRAQPLRSLTEGLLRLVLTMERAFHGYGIQAVELPPHPGAIRLTNFSKGSKDAIFHAMHFQRYVFVAFCKLLCAKFALERWV